MNPGPAHGQAGACHGAKHRRAPTQAPRCLTPSSRAMMPARSSPRRWVGGGVGGWVRGRPLRAAGSPTLVALTGVPSWRGVPSAAELFAACDGQELGHCRHHCGRRARVPLQRPAHWSGHPMRRGRQRGSSAPAAGGPGAAPGLCVWNRRQLWPAAALCRQVCFNQHCRRRCHRAGWRAGTQPRPRRRGHRLAATTKVPVAPPLPVAVPAGQAPPSVSAAHPSDQAEPPSPPPSHPGTPATHTSAASVRSAGRHLADSHPDIPL